MVGEGFTRRTRSEVDRLTYIHLVLVTAWLQSRVVPGRASGLQIYGISSAEPIAVYRNKWEIRVEIVGALKMTGRLLALITLLALCLSGTATAQQTETLEFSGTVAGFDDDVVIDGYRFRIMDPFSDSILSSIVGLADVGVLNFIFTYTSTETVRVEVDGDLLFSLDSVDLYGTQGSVDIVALDDADTEIISATYDLAVIGGSWTTLQFDSQWNNVRAVEFRVNSDGFPALAIDNLRVTNNGINMATISARLFSTVIDTGAFEFTSHGNTDYMATNEASPEPIPDGMSALYAVDIPDTDSTVVNLERMNGGLFSLQRLNTYVFDTVSCVPAECRGESFSILALDAAGSVIATETVSSADGSGWRTISFDDSVWTGIRTLRLGVQGGIPGMAGTAYGFFDNFWLSADPLDVSVDVDLWDNANQINPAGTVEIPVGLLSSSIAAGDAVEFDAVTIDIDSLRFGAGEVANVLVTPFTADHNSDGLIDMTASFPTEGSGIACGDTEVSVTGQTTDGLDFRGSDVIETTDCEAGCHP